MSWKPEIPFEARFHDIFNRLYVISWGGFFRIPLHC